MDAYRAQIRMTLRLMMRNRGALFFGYLLPLVFFFMFGQLFRAGQGGASQVVSMVLTLGVLGSGIFGAAMIAVMNRKQNVLRRFKVAPISPAAILVSSLIVSLLNYLPLAALLIILANRFVECRFRIGWALCSCSCRLACWRFVRSATSSLRL